MVSAILSRFCGLDGGEKTRSKKKSIFIVLNIRADTNVNNLL